MSFWSSIACSTSRRRAVRRPRVRDRVVEARVARDPGEQRRLGERQRRRRRARSTSPRPAGPRRRRSRNRSCSGRRSGSGPSTSACSSCHASAASFSLRLIVRCSWTYVFLTNCCVIVEPPSTTCLVRTSARPRGDAAEVDAAVLEEALVLDRDDRLLHQRRDLVRVDDHPRSRTRAGRRGPACPPSRRSARRARAAGSSAPRAAGCRSGYRAPSRRRTRRSRTDPPG